MERLTEYLGGIPHIKRTINGINSKANYLRDFDIEAVKKLAYYEDLEEQGRLVVLPCKVGDTIYRLSRERDEVWDWEVAEVHILSDYYGEPISFVDDSDNEFFASDIGKTVFLTRAEAEKAMEVSEDA